MECVSNLLANEMFGEKKDDKDTVKRILDSVIRLSYMADTLVVVTDDVFRDGMEYDGDTLRYICYLSQINNELAKRSDRVTEVIAGIPVNLKK